MRAGLAHKAINRDNSTVIGKGDMSVGMSPFFCHFGTRRPHSGIGTTLDNTSGVGRKALRKKA